MALGSTDEVVTKDSPVDGSDSGGTMADETLGSPCQMRLFLPW